MYVVARESVTCEPSARKPAEETKFSHSQTRGDSAVKTMVMRGTCSFSKSCSRSAFRVRHFYCHDSLQKPSTSALLDSCRHE